MVWVKEYGLGRRRPKRRKPPRRYSWELKLEAVERMESGECVDDIARDLRIDVPPLLYQWARNWAKEGRWGLMTRQERKRAFATRGQLEGSLPDDPEELRALAARLLVEKAVLEKEIEFLGKDPGSIPGQLPNKTKARIVEHLRQEYPLTVLLEVIGLKESTYYYCRNVAAGVDKYSTLRGLIQAIAVENRFIYGSQRIWIALRQLGHKVSEKVVRRLMKEERVPVYYAKKKRRYSSYEGEVSPAPDNRIKRDFHAEKPNQKWLTDVSEFPGPDGKVYFSPIMDCYDGYIVAYRRQRTADKTLTQGTLEDAIATLPQVDYTDERPILHSDRGGHYRCKDWIARADQAGIRRSMSKKGCSPDNARCEGFFGTMKNEIFYGRHWKTVTEIEEAIDWYVDWYNNTRIKTELGGLTIRAYRAKTLTTKTL
nr:IS3 family transposase [Schaalia sp. lx-100]